MGYAHTIEGIKSSSMTQAPAILIEAVENAVKKGAFNGDGGLLSMVCRVLLKERGPSDETEAHYCWSDDGEQYHGQYETRSLAIEAMQKENGRYTGRSVTPTSPAEFWHAEDWLEHVSVQEEYTSEFAEGWDASTQEQRDELEQLVYVVMSDWLSRHDLLPKFFTVDMVVDHQAGDGTEAKS